MIVDREVCSKLVGGDRSVQMAAMPPRGDATANRPMMPVCPWAAIKVAPAKRLWRVALGMPATGRDDGSIDQGESSPRQSCASSKV